MKCPKCGYTSFESYDACRRCSADLVEFKQTHGLAALVLPPALRASMATEPDSNRQDEETPADAGGDMFAFDLPTEQQAAPPGVSGSSDPFSFDAPPAASAAFSFDSPPASAQDDPFAALLETTPKQEPQQSPPPADPVGGFELNSFSWDDTPAPGQPDSAPAEPAKPADDDFNSLFGDLDGSDKK